ncbi:MAG: acyltransferase family protein, partial [Planktothrix sp.]
MENRLVVFDWMRTIGIFMILAHHLPKYYLGLQVLDQDKIDINLLSFYELNRYFSLGLFVFISGYLINQKRKRFLNSRSLLKFLYKKFIRVFPLYYLALIAFIYMYQVFDPVSIIIHILGLQLLFVSDTFSALPTLWFIGLIVIYYSLFMILNYQPIKPIYKIFLIVFFPILMVTLALYFEITDL